MKRFETILLAALAAFTLAVVALPHTVLAQIYPAVAGDVTGILGSYPLFPYGLRASVLDQQAAGKFAVRGTLATGVYTYTFPAAYASAPICTASEESTTGHYVKITAISATAVTFTSDVTSANADPVDVVCVGNPS